MAAWHAERNTTSYYLTISISNYMHGRLNFTPEDYIKLFVMDNVTKFFQEHAKYLLKDIQININLHKAMLNE